MLPPVPPAMHKDKNSPRHFACRSQTHPCSTFPPMDYFLKAEESTEDGCRQQPRGSSHLPRPKHQEIAGCSCSQNFPPHTPRYTKYFSRICLFLYLYLWHRNAYACSVRLVGGHSSEGGRRRWSQDQTNVQCKPSREWCCRCALS